MVRAPGCQKDFAELVGKRRTQRAGVAQANGIIRHPGKRLLREDLQSGRIGGLLPVGLYRAEAGLILESRHLCNFRCTEHQKQEGRHPPLHRVLPSGPSKPGCFEKFHLLYPRAALALRVLMAYEW